MKEKLYEMADSNSQDDDEDYRNIMKIFGKAETLVAPKDAHGHERTPVAKHELGNRKPRTEI